MDNMLPLVRQYLTPDAANPTGQTVVVEFYNASLDHYFMTADPNEINLLDTGALRGWVRTGARFLVYASATSGANPVCRFYLKPEVGDSHFYSADPAECERVRQRSGQTWTYESPSVFRIALPDTTTGVCPANTAAGLALLQPADHEPPLHHRGLRARPPAGRSRVDRRGLRPGRRDHVLADGERLTAGGSASNRRLATPR